MEHHLPKWALPAAAALVVLFLLIKGRSSGAGGAAVSTAPSADPLQAAANQLAQQQSQADLQRQNALANVSTTGAAEQQVLMDCKKLFSDPSYACPGGGRPRVVTTNAWPYVGCGCIAPKTGAITLGSVLGVANQLSGLFGNPFGGGGGSSSSGDTPAGPAGQPYGPGINEGWGVLPGGSSNNPGEIA